MELLESKTISAEALLDIVDLEDIINITAYQQLMWEVFCNQYWERVGIHEFDFCITDHWQESFAKFAYQTGWQK